MSQNLLGLTSLVFLGVMIGGCGKKSDKDKSTSNIPVDVQMNSTLALAYPEGLSVPSFPQSLETSTTLAAVGDNQTLNQKALEAKAVLEGTVTDCFEILQKRSILPEPTEGLERCYEFDQEMIYGYRDNVINLSGTTDGLSRKTGSQEVCMISFAREQMRIIERRIDESLDRAQVMSCLAKKEGKRLPSAVGDSLDLTQIMNAKRSSAIVNPPIFDSVVMKRLVDVESRPVFETTIKVTKNNNPEELIILHSPQSLENNDSYNGVISLKRPEAQKTKAISIEYARSNLSGVKRLKASVRSGNFAQSYVTLFDVNGRVNYADLPINADNSLVNGMMMVEFDLNQSDSTGNLSYWKNPGGNYTESARGFVFRVEKDTTTSRLKGCAVSGAAKSTSIRKAISENISLKPNGWYHPFFVGTQASDISEYDYKGTNPVAYWKKPSFSDATLAASFVTNQTGDMVSRQCYSQDQNGNYVIDSTAGIGGTAGYELIPITDSTKFISSPALDGVTGKKLK